jgi:hypothetical protein
MASSSSVGLPEEEGGLVTKMIRCQARTAGERAGYTFAYRIGE